MDKDTAIKNLRTKVKKARMKTAMADVTLRQRALRAEHKPTVEIEEVCDGFAIIVDGVRFSFDQEEDKKGLIKVFKKLGITATYEEVY